MNTQENDTPTPQAAAETARKLVDSVDFWESIALKNEHKSWDDWYITETVMGADFYSERDDMPCPECGETLAVFFGQIDQDWQGNDIHGAGFICHACGFDDIESID